MPVLLPMIWTVAPTVSVQEKSTSLQERAVAVSPVMAGAVAQATAVEAVPVPYVFTASTSKAYSVPGVKPVIVVLVPLIPLATTLNVPASVLDCRTVYVNGVVPVLGAVHERSRTVVELVASLATARPVTWPGATPEAAAD